MNTLTQNASKFMSPKNSMMNMEQRGFYLVLGLGIVVMAMAFPPVSKLWMATINITGIVLVMLSIVGKRMLATRKENGTWLEPKQFTSIATASIGIALSVLAIASPPVSTSIAAFVHILGIFLVIHSILDAGSFLRTRTIIGNQVYTLEPTTKGNTMFIPPLRTAA
ncbi:MAG: hypothetical protein OEZ43_15695 [Gammaproteobacteria bacterium]|nr:hypothetical protein [Gammaproteobacteria bacterium]